MASSLFLANSLPAAQRSICRDSRRPIPHAAGAWLFRQTRIVSAKVSERSSAPPPDSSAASSSSDSSSNPVDSSGPLTPLPYPERDNGPLIPRPYPENDYLMTGEWAYILLTAAAVPMMLWSMYTLKTTGCKLPSLPGGFIGSFEVSAAFHIQYMVVLSLGSRIRTGKGLAPGPYGLLRVAEWAAFACYIITILTYVDKYVSTGTVLGRECFPYLAW